MPILRILLSAVILLIAAVLSVSPKSSFADTYQIVQIGMFEQIYGIDTFGVVVLQEQWANCWLYPQDCYIADGGAVGRGNSYSANPPALDYDNGTSCSFTPPVFQQYFVVGSLCNNGRQLIMATLGPGDVIEIFVGNQFIASMYPATSSSYKIVMNGLGDIAFTENNGAARVYEAVDLTSQATPEPSSLLLLATGMLGAAALLRRQVAR